MKFGYKMASKVLLSIKRFSKSLLLSDRKNYAEKITSRRNAPWGSKRIKMEGLGEANSPTYLMQT